MRRGKRIHATMAHALDRSSAARLNEETNELLIVSDMGSAQLDLLESLPYPVIVLDHHKPIRDSDKVAHVNPHFEGVDGAREMCGATTKWLFPLRPRPLRTAAGRPGIPPRGRDRPRDAHPPAPCGGPTQARLHPGGPTPRTGHRPGGARVARRGSVLDRAGPDVRAGPGGLREQLRPPRSRGPRPGPLPRGPRGVGEGREAPRGVHVSRPRLPRRTRNEGAVPEEAHPVLLLRRREPCRIRRG